jgi:hypothetical protein
MSQLTQLIHSWGFSISQKVRNRNIAYVQCNVLHVTVQCNVLHVTVHFMFVVPNILVTYAFIQLQPDVLYGLFPSWKILSSTCFRCYLHPSSTAQLQCTAVGFYGIGVFYSRAGTGADRATVSLYQHRTSSCNWIKAYVTVHLLQWTVRAKKKLVKIYEN